MATYVTADIHGNYEKYMQAIEAIALKDDDTLYILGDVLDRGKNPIKILKDMMGRRNIVPILGNHEFIAYSILNGLTQDVTEDTLHLFDVKFLQELQLWLEDGGETTLAEFQSLPKQERQQILDYIKEFELYEEIVCGGVEYVLVHAGLANFSQDKELYEYDLYELISARTDYSKVYYENKILVTGHTPVQNITGGKSTQIYKKNNHIAIDCGCGYGGQLGVLCLDTMEEIYF